MVESDIVMLPIRFRAWGVIYAVGPSVATVQTPRRPFPYDIRQQKVLDIAIDEVFVVPIRVIVLLGLRNPPHRCIGTVSLSLPGFTIAPCVDSLLCYRSIRRPKSILQDSPKL
jgi:hypothetical protein